MSTPSSSLGMLAAVNAEGAPRSVSEAIYIETLKGGAQARNYGPHEYLSRVHFVGFDYRGKPFATGEFLGASEGTDEWLVDRALVILGWQDLPRNDKGECAPIADAEAYFRGDVRYARIIAPGVIEAYKEIPYCD